MADDPACCGACAHLARVAHDGAPTRPETPPLRFDLAADGAPRGAVLVIDGDREIPLDRVATTIGRGAASDIVIRDPNLSRITCKLEFSADGGCFIADMGSTCGVVVNDLRVDRAGLHEGDTILLADRVLRVVRR